MSNVFPSSSNVTNRECLKKLKKKTEKELVEVSSDDCQVDQSGIPLLNSDTSAFVDALDGIH